MVFLLRGRHGVVTRPHQSGTKTNIHCCIRTTRVNSIVGDETCCGTGGRRRIRRYLVFMTSSCGGQSTTRCLRVIPGVHGGGYGCHFRGLRRKTIRGAMGSPGRRDSTGWGPGCSITLERVTKVVFRRPGILCLGLTVVPVLTRPLLECFRPVESPLSRCIRPRTVV